MPASVLRQKLAVDLDMSSFDLSVTSPHNPSLLSEAGHTAGSAAVTAELRKHSAKMQSVQSWGGCAFPLWQRAESYGAWGKVAVHAFSRLVSHLATNTRTF